MLDCELGHRSGGRVAASRLESGPRLLCESPEGGRSEAISGSLEAIAESSESDSATSHAPKAPKGTLTASPASPPEQPPTAKENHKPKERKRPRMAISFQDLYFPFYLLLFPRFDRMQEQKPKESWPGLLLSHALYCSIDLAML